MLDYGDIESIKYFIQERDDITRWVDWNKKREEVFKTFPALEKALTDYEQSKKLLYEVLDAMDERCVSCPRHKDI